MPSTTRRAAARLLALLLPLWLGCGDADRLELEGEPADQGVDQGQQPDQPPDMRPIEEMGHDLPDAAPDQAPDMPPGEDMALDMADDMPADMPPAFAGPARYPASAAISPVSAATVARWEAIRDGGPPGADERVFIKVGASGTVSTRLLTCFEPGSSFGYDLAGRSHLQAIIDHVRAARVAGGTTSFARVTEAAEVGRTARWAVTGSPSPVERELAALRPRYAFVNYGTNDMGGAASYESALWVFWTHMNTLLDTLEDQGVIPIITGLNPRDDRADAAAWVPVFDALTRGLAEQRQLPYLSLYLSTKDMPNMGLIGDGLHGNAFSSGGATRPCHMTDPALNFNYNLRNLESLNMLDRVWRALSGEDVVSRDLETWHGRGTKDDPFIVDKFPFTHSATTLGAERLNAGYPSCDGGQDEGGGEVYYRIVLSSPRTVRVMAFDREADVDVHLLESIDEASACVARHDRTIERMLPAGTHTIVIDTYVSNNGVAQEGEFLFVAVER